MLANAVGGGGGGGGACWPGGELKPAAAAAACIEEAAANQESIPPKWCDMIGGGIDCMKRLWPRAKDMSFDFEAGTVGSEVDGGEVLGACPDRVMYEDEFGDGGDDSPPLGEFSP